MWRTGNLQGLVRFEAKAIDLSFEAKGLQMRRRDQGPPRGLHLCYSC